MSDFANGENRYVRLHFAKRRETLRAAAERRNGTLYTGIASDLPKRIWRHKNETVPGFTARYMAAERDPSISVR